MSGLFTPEIRDDPAAVERNREWIEALRSGNYPQATGTLCHIDPSTGEVIGYCCLGLPCLLQKLPVVDTWVTVRRIFAGPDSEIMWNALSSPGLRKLYRLTTSAGHYTDPAGNPSSLAYDNDANHLNFPQIANIIERQLTEALA